MKRARKPNSAPLEEQSQAAFFQWWEIWAPLHKLPVQLLFAVPNGGHRHPAVAAKLKAQGVRRGVPDVFLDIPAGGWHGLRLEFKRKGKSTSPEQQTMLAELRRRNYNALVVWSTEEAMRAVMAYLSFADRKEDRVPMRV
jgi:hypothetical protein